MTHDLPTAIGVGIVAAAVFALIARGTRQPPLLGYIAGGAVLGPHVGLGLVTDERSIEVVSEIGLIFLLFIIGLEISVPQILKTGRTILVTGLLQFPICAALVWWTFRDSVAGGRPLDGLYLAVALSLSSTLIVVKLLFDKYEIMTFGGKITLGILIFQDLWAIAFMALQPSLQHLRPGPLFRSFAAGALLVGAAALLSRFVLPALFRSLAGSHELLLITAVAWCFLVAGAAGAAGLSSEMGALIAGLVLAAFPYSMEVTSRLSGVRDFFVTLFFVTLGLKLPVPSEGLFRAALAGTGIVILSRLVAIFPLFALLRLDTRTAGVVAINLAQVSEFSLVIMTLGEEHGHVSRDVASLVLYTLLITAVLSTYLIRYNHVLATGLAHMLALGGLPRWLRRRRRPAGDDGASAAPRDFFLLGVSREALAFLQHLERDAPALKGRIRAIDFNPETLERLETAGVESSYGDISNIETLRQAGLDRASLVVSSISDTYLRGTDNARLLRLIRSLAPRAAVVVTADSVAAAQQLYADGADYVVIPAALAGEHLFHLLEDGSPETLARARREQATDVFRHSG
jgi:Kef-type K+ transport system membrane component KefB